jgi:serine/threonine protein kinase
MSINDPHAPVEPGSDVPLMLAGRYHLEGLIATGGMATVYVGKDVALHRRVAIKILHSKVAQSAGAIERFRREARTAARLHSPHIATVYDFGELAEHGAFIAMELLLGPTLRQRLRERPALSPHEAVSIARQILSALEVAHRARVLHLDLTPSNLILTRASSGELHCKVVDFGISRAFDDRGRAGQTRPVFGTRNYVAPEVRRGVPPDLRADVYSVGVILYEMISGAVPPAECLDGEEELPASIPVPLRPLICKALRADPDDRWQSAAALSAAMAHAHGLVPPCETCVPVTAGDSTPQLYAPTLEIPAAAPAGKERGCAVTVALARRRPLPAWKSIAAGIVLAAGLGAFAQRTYSPEQIAHTGSQPPTSPTVEVAPPQAAEVLVVAAPDTRAILATALREWINATNAGDLERQRQFYPAIMDDFYLWRRVPQAAVMAEKQRVFATADVIDIRIGPPEIRFNAEGTEATMQFRKRYVIRGPRLSRQGEVMQQLRWARGDEGWRIVSERDLRVIA